jgi:hypothetical protein
MSNPFKPTLNFLRSPLLKGKGLLTSIVKVLELSRSRLIEKEIDYLVIEVVKLLIGILTTLLLVTLVTALTKYQTNIMSIP